MDNDDYYDECGYCGFIIDIDELTDDNFYNNVVYCDSCADLIKTAD